MGGDRHDAIDAGSRQLPTQPHRLEVRARSAPGGVARPATPGVPNDPLRHPAAVAVLQPTGDRHGGVYLRPEVETALHRGALTGGQELDRDADGGLRGRGRLIGRQAAFFPLHRVGPDGRGSGAQVELEEVAIHQRRPENAGKGDAPPLPVDPEGLADRVAATGTVAARIGILHHHHFDLGRPRSAEAGGDRVALSWPDDDGTALQQDRLPTGRAASAGLSLERPVGLDLQPADRSPAVGTQLEAAVVEPVALALRQGAGHASRARSRPALAQLHVIHPEIAGDGEGDVDARVGAILARSARHLVASPFRRDAQALPQIALVGSRVLADADEHRRSDAATQPDGERIDLPGADGDAQLPDLRRAVGHTFAVDVLRRIPGVGMGRIAGKRGRGVSIGIVQPRQGDSVDVRRFHPAVPDHGAWDDGRQHAGITKVDSGDGREHETKQRQGSSQRQPQAPAAGAHPPAGARRGE